LKCIVFLFCQSGRLKRGGWQSSTAEKQSTVAVHQASPGGPSHQVAHQGSWAPSLSPVDSPAAVKVTGIKRKEATGTKVERQHNKKVASVLFSPVKFNQCIILLDAFVDDLETVTYWVSMHFLMNLSNVGNCDDCN
jgi:hypothetical protein